MALGNQAKPETGEPMQSTNKRPNKRQLRAMAYALADEAETRAAAIQARNPRLSFIDALNRALADMGGI
jgi:hypothetical protein